MTPLPVPLSRTDPGAAFGHALACGACAAGLVFAFAFSAFPGVDLAVSDFFYLGDGRFLFERPSLAAAIRDLLRLIFALACAAAVAAFLSLAFLNRKLFGLGLAASAYIALCAAAGPGLVANLGFKDHWGRARPAQITEFGGAKQFTPPLLRTDQCERNCAFVSGEASNFYMLGFAAAFLASPARRRAVLIAAIAAGSFAGLIRIGGGGHFLSDVVFAGIFMALVAQGLAWLILRKLGAHLADGGRFHESALRFGRRLGVRIKSLWTSLAAWLHGRAK